MQCRNDILCELLNSRGNAGGLPGRPFDMILEIRITAVAKPGPQANVTGVPTDLLLKQGPGGVNSRGRYELVAEVQGPESSIAEGLAAQVEDSL